LIGWDHTNVEALRDILAGSRPAFYARFDPGWAAFNAELVARFEINDWDALVAALRRSQEAFLAAVSALPEEELRRDRGQRWRGHVITIGGILRAALRDEAAHLRQIEAFAAPASP
jgi:hypothetical protein